MGELRHEKWAGTTYGTGWMHRWLIRLLRVTDVRVIYAVTDIFVLPPTLIFSGNGRRQSYHFARKGLGLGKWRAARHVWRNYRSFSRVVIDRFASYAGKLPEIEIENFNVYQRLQRGSDGFVQISSHIGNYEMAGYALVSGKPIKAAVFGGEKGSVMASRDKIFSEHNISMVPVDGDLRHLFVFNAALDNGEVVSMPGDRVFGSNKSYRIPFLGSDATFPVGPFTLAAAKNVPMVFVAVMQAKPGKYRIHIHEIKSPGLKSVRANAEGMAHDFVKALENIVRRYPAQWYNYFNIWADD